MDLWPFQFFQFRFASLLKLKIILEEHLRKTVYDLRPVNDDKRLVKSPVDEWKNSIIQFRDVVELAVGSLTEDRMRDSTVWKESLKTTEDG